MPSQLASSPLAIYTPHPVASKRNARCFERVNGCHLSGDTFMEEYAMPGKPCLVVEDQEQTSLPSWSLTDLEALYTTRRIRSEALTMSMSCYAAYARSCQDSQTWIPDESPFYLFDPTLAKTMQKDGTFVVPPYVRERNSNNHSVMRKDWDLFSLLKEQRPDHAWVIAGPSRSGSGWHVDPNGTSAYNTVLSGRKLWMLLPPTITPPGVFISADGSSVTAPLSIIEWLLHFFDECVRLHGHHGDDTLILDICSKGETVFIPAGWRHLVINLDESVAFTQNFCSSAELPAVLDFLKNRPEQISGFRLGKGGKVESRGDDEEGSDPELDDLPHDGIEQKRALFDLFIERLGRFDSTLLQKGLQGMVSLEEREERKREQVADAATLTKVRNKRNEAQTNHSLWWDTLKQEREESTFGFVFDLVDGDE
ncbi:hypothetical protein CBS101457_000427 [Exobasidium rhododendri]|nr:hypothetical protein CBS101457_000427 [Exobasidium rhododendri]